MFWNFIITRWWWYSCIFSLKSLREFQNRLPYSLNVFRCPDGSGGPFFFSSQFRYPETCPPTDQPIFDQQHNLLARFQIVSWMYANAYSSLVHCMVMTKLHPTKKGAISNALNLSRRTDLNGHCVARNSLKEVLVAPCINYDYQRCLLLTATCQIGKDNLGNWFRMNCSTKLTPIRLYFFIRQFCIHQTVSQFVAHSGYSPELLNSGNRTLACR